jgi:hypothetical protein
MGRRARFRGIGFIEEGSRFSSMYSMGLRTEIWVI